MYLKLFNALYICYIFKWFKNEQIKCKNIY